MWLYDLSSESSSEGEIFTDEGIVASDDNEKDKKEDPKLLKLDITEEHKNLGLLTDKTLVTENEWLENVTPGGDDQYKVLSALIHTMHIVMDVYNICNIYCFYNIAFKNDIIFTIFTTTLHLNK